jgi:hypothetical protein
MKGAGSCYLIDFFFLQIIAVNGSLILKLPDGAKQIIQSADVNL